MYQIYTDVNEYLLWLLDLITNRLYFQNMPTQVVKKKERKKRKPEGVEKAESV